MPPSAAGGDSAVAFWLEAAGRHPRLTPAEVLHLGGLVRRWQGHGPWVDGDGTPHEGGPDDAPPAITRRGLRARDRMVTGNLRLVASYLKKHRRDGPLIDQLQNGALGLARAAEKFDPSKGYAFSTYAYWWIRQAVTNGERDEAAIRLPMPVHAAIRGQRNGACPPESLAAGLAAASLLPLDSPLPGDRDGNPSTLLDTLAAPDREDLMHSELLEFLLEWLDERGQRLLRGRYGIGEPVATIAEQAEREGLTRHRTSRLIREALGTLRRLSGVDPPPDPVVAPPPPPPVATLPPAQPGECCQLSLRLPILNP